MWLEFRKITPLHNIAIQPELCQTESCTLIHHQCATKIGGQRFRVSRKNQWDPLYPYCSSFVSLSEPEALFVNRLFYFSISCFITIELRIANYEVSFVLEFFT